MMSKTWRILALGGLAVGFGGPINVGPATAQDPAWREEIGPRIVVTLAGSELGEQVIREAVLLAMPWEALSGEIFPSEAPPVKIIYRRRDDEELIEEDARGHEYNPRRARVLLVSRKLYRFAPRVVVTLRFIPHTEERLERERRVHELVIDWFKKAEMRLLMSEWSIGEIEELVADSSTFGGEPLMWIRGEIGE